MLWSTSVLTTLSSDTEPSFMITFNDSKYIFNTSENTMRSFLQSGRLWRRTKALFFTQARVEKMSGLPGLIMTFADATINKLQIAGPPGLNHLLASMRQYTFRDSIEIQPSEIPWTTPTSPAPTPCYADHNVTIYSIPILPFSEPLSVPSESDPEFEPTSASASEEGPDTTENSGKRKRELSADTSRKRLNPGSAISIFSDEMRQGGLKAEDLTGEAADEYRRLMVRTMFPGTNIRTPEEEAERNRTGKRKKGHFQVLSHSNADVDEHRQTRASVPQGFWKQLPKYSNSLPSSNTPSTLSYLVIGPRYRGKFDAEKAVELGVPRGPLRGRLSKGETITFDVKVGGETIQRTVKPEEVIGKSEAPGAIVILDVPSTAHIPSLVSSFRDSEFYRKCWSEDRTSVASTEPEFVIRTVYHTCGDGVLEDERYKTFMNGFGPEVHHVISSREHCPDPVTFTSAAYNQLRLNELDEKIFPVPKYSLVPKKDIATIPGLPPKVHLMASNLHTVMRPFTPPAPDPAIVALDKFHPIVSGAKPVEFSPALQRSIRTGKWNVSQVLSGSDLKPMEGADVGIVTLGTSGSLPSKYRNVLSTLVKIPGRGNILLDAGEGTWGQLVRNYGLEDGTYNVWQALRDIKCIFISHIHADHHAGLAHLLAKRRLLDPPPNEPLYVVSVRSVHLYLRELQDVQDIGIEDPSGNGIIPILSESLHYSDRGTYMTTGMWQIGGTEPWLDYRTSVENGRKMCDALGLEYFKTVDVQHRCRCFGVSFRHKDGWSVTFSADTSPSESLCRVGMNSTVLIHEATMGDDEADMARRKSHSTIGQAIAEGKNMKAKNLLLTHFSARYPKLPPYVTKELSSKADVTMYDQDTFIVPSFDHMNMTIGDMWKMQFYLLTLLRNFREALDEDEESIPSSASPARSKSPARSNSPMWRSSAQKSRY
ncbi:hypothetical protein BDZ97DRAFT_1848960 [Flammula alnicola]|nr:hypothetical protein BDZ97DRAFT_1848960 [Flammula alnicola]